MIRTRTITLFRYAAAIAVAAAAWAPAAAKVLLTQEEALKLAFGEAAAERKTAYLTDEQAASVRAAAGSDLPSRVVVYYAGGDPARPVSAYFDTHLVRTLPETVMIVVEGPGKVRRVDILSFDEPVDYLPSPRWLAQFEGKPLSPDVETSRGIRAVAGATLSSKAITAAVRRALALHALLDAPPEAETGKEPQR